ncbi:MAG: DUF4159 domain-containing protein [Phycisphaerae bacterium]|nr:DUF4159 domain-containing protein [Phycisphaerae bacterium]
MSKLYIISNGVRPLAIHIEEDLSRTWQLNAWKNQPRDFEMLANLVRYTLGGVKPLPPRGRTHWPEEPKDITAEATLVRVQHKGNFSPEPLAHERFTRLLGRREKIRLAVETKTPKQLRDSKAKVAMLTGTGELSLETEQTEAIRAWVAGGGTLLIDAAGGDRTFAESAKQWIEKTYGTSALWSLSKDSLVYTAKGDERKNLPYRLGLPEKKRRKRKRRMDIQAVMIPTPDGGDHRAGVLFSRGDITAGLLGNPSGIVFGYAPEAAYTILRNLIVTAGGVEKIQSTPERGDRKAPEARQPSRPPVRRRSRR